MEPLNFRILNIDFRTPDIEPELFLMQRFHFKTAEINIKIRKPHFKIRKLILKRDKNKSVYEINVEKDGGII